MRRRERDKEADAPADGHRGAARRRAAWSAADQGLFSLTNLALNLLVAQNVSQRAFGSFSVAYMVYILFSNSARAVGSEPLVIRYSARYGAQFEAAMRKTLGFGVAAGLASGVIIGAVGLLLTGPVRFVVLALAVCLPGLMLQDACRFAFFAKGRPHQAACNEALWVVMMGAGYVVLRWQDAVGAGSLVLLWGMAGSLAGLVGLVQARALPQVRQAWCWISENRDIAPGLLADFVLLIGASQVASFTVGIVAGLDELGALRAASVLVGPVTTVLTAARVTVVPEMVRIGARGRPIVRLVVRISAGLGTVTALMTLGLVVLPDQVGRRILGASWADARKLTVLVALGIVAVALNVGPIAGLRAMAALRRVVRARSMMTAFVVIGGVSGAFLGGAVGSAAGNAVGNFLGVLVWWRELRAELRARAGPSRAIVLAPAEPDGSRPRPEEQEQPASSSSGSPRPEAEP